MSGTKEGGQRAANTNRERHGQDYFAKIGSAGGKAFHKLRGFQTMDPVKHHEVSVRGGKLSRRSKPLPLDRPKRTFFGRNKAIPLASKDNA